MKTFPKDILDSKVTVETKDNLPSRDEKKGTQSIDRALDILTSFNFANPAWDAAGLSHKLGLALPTVKRILDALESKGILTKDRKRKEYRVGLKIFELGGVAYSQISLVNLSNKILLRLREETNETVHFGVVLGDELLYIKKLESPDVFDMTSPVGLRRPLTAGSQGKAILSTYPLPLLENYLSTHVLEAYTPNSVTDPKIYIEQLAKVREQGFAIDREELFEGICAVASAITRGDGLAIGGISVAFSAINYDETKVLRWAQLVRQAGLSISRQIFLNGEVEIPR